MAATTGGDINEAAAPDRVSTLPRISQTVLAYPIPILAISGLLLGLGLTYGGNRPDLARLAWYGTLILGGVPLVFYTVRRLLRREFASDIIASLAILAAIALDQSFAGTIIVLMQSGGEAIENYAHHRATASLERLTRGAPRWAYRYRDGSLQRVPVDEVQPGDRLAVRSGDVLPVDGAVVGSPAIVDEAAVTGEPLPRTIGVGESVLSGMVNAGPTFDLVTTRPSRESQYARIVTLVRNAQTQKPTIQRLADRYAAWFTPTTIVIALAAAFFGHSAVTGLAVLVVATPCPLILATPIAVLRAIDRASGRGIVVKSGAAIEEMGRARTVLFDKTGTLTTGRPEIDRIVAFAEASPEDILRLASALEQFSSHPLFEAVIRRAKGAHFPPVQSHHEHSGTGVEGTVDGRRLVFGSRGLCEVLANRGLDREWEQVRSSGPVEGRLVSFLVADGRPIGAILFEDPMRPEVPGLIERLRRLGIHRTGVLTGDNRPNAEQVASRAGIDSIDADLRPEQKVERVGEYRRRYGSTIMVGDGINDAAALAAASVGIAMGARGAGISAEAADAVLLVDDVGRVADGIELGQRMLSIARQGILFGLGASFVFMGIASFGYIPPADGAVVQELLDATVIFNALRVR